MWSSSCWGLDVSVSFRMGEESDDGAEDELPLLSTCVVISSKLTMFVRGISFLVTIVPSLRVAPL